MTKNPKAKGSTFERTICKQLSEWWSEGKSDDIFWRTASSGGRATQRTKKGLTTNNQGGDVTFTDPSGAAFIKLFAIEIKKGYPKFEAQRALDRETNTKPSLFEEWVMQAQASQIAANSFSWMLITKKDRAKTLIWLPVEIFKEISSHEKIPMLELKNIIKGVDIVGMELASLLEVFNPAALRSYYDKRVAL